MMFYDFVVSLLISILGSILGALILRLAEVVAESISCGRQLMRSNQPQKNALR